MSDYNLQGLNPRDFQHLVQAICRRRIAAGVTALGDGPDGGRDLFFRGQMDYPSTSAGWNGYLVVGCKFKQALSDSKTDGNWALQQLEQDLKKFKSRSRKLRKPEYYVFATNVRLTAVHRVGSRDRVSKLLDSYATALKIKAHAVWDYNDLRGFIDADEDIRGAYTHFITAGDVLAEVIKHIKLERADFVGVMHAFLQKELIADFSAKLQSAGDDPERQIPLSSLFVDLPFTDSPEKAVLLSGEDQNRLPKVVEFLLHAGERILRKQGDVEDTGKDRSRARADSRFVIVGGPGQGKSTFGQYLCQLYRAAILKDRPPSRLDDVVPPIIKQLNVQQEAAGGLPLARRFPLRIELRNFSHALGVNPNLTLLEYIREDVSRLGASTLLVSDLKTWLACYPWLFVLDGLDEVPASSNRQRVLQEITSLRVDLAAGNADVLLVATTRPQGYSSDFSNEIFTHLYLTPLTAEQALEYGRKLVKAWCATDERRQGELTSSLHKACENPTTSRLMQSPLQVTIMTTLLEEMGEPPQQRYRLFAEYYRTIYKRETRRKLLGGILSERQKDIDTIHQQVGLILQSRAEGSVAAVRQGKVEDVDSALADDEFRSVVRQRLDQIKIAEPRASELVDTISAGSLQRLVFLVRPRDGWIRFDITSFKEFMAAEALMNGSDDNVRLRLTETAAVTYWRNVFLFAVGKCFVEKEHMLDTIVRLCMALNDESSCSNIVRDELAAKSARAALWGSRLALDVLTDGTARQDPGYEAQFATIALRLLREPDDELCARLASVYNEDLRRVFVETVRDRLGQTSLRAKVGAWRLLADLADREVSWARDLLMKTWPDDISAQREILAERRLRHNKGWAATKLNALVPKIEPWWLMRFGIARVRDRDCSSYIPKVYQLLHELPKPQLRISIESRSLALGGVVTAIGVTPCDAHRELWELMRDIEFSNQAWLPFVSGVRFSANPSAKTLAIELRHLAKSWNGERIWLRRFPWPLGACLLSAGTKEGLEELAEKAECGALGDEAEWRTAEKRWRASGVAWSDIMHVPELPLPFGKDIGSIGFPWAAGELTVDGSVSSERITEAVRVIRELPNAVLRSNLASAMLGTWSYPQSPDSYLDPSQFRALFELRTHRSAMSWDVHVRIDAFVARAHADGFGEAWIEFFNWLGTQCVWMYLDTGRGGGERLIQRFSADPERYRGLLPVIARLATAGYKCAIPRSALDTAFAWDERARVDAVGLMLAGERLTSEEIEQLANLIVSDAVLVDELYRILRMAAAGTERQAVDLALRVLNLEGESALNDQAVESARRMIVGFLTKMRSSLGEPAMWQRLNLPGRV